MFEICGSILFIIILWVIVMALDKKNKSKEIDDGDILEKDRQKEIRALERKKQEIDLQEAEEKRRKSTPCNFSEGMSEYVFTGIIKVVRYSYDPKRLLDLYNDGPFVYGIEKLPSDETEWNFEIDFNDYGRVTGTCWYEYRSISKEFVNAIVKKINTLINFYYKFEGSDTEYLKTIFNMYVNQEYLPSKNNVTINITNFYS